MRAAQNFVWLAIVLLFAGCQQNPFLAGGQRTSLSPQQLPQYQAQLQDLNRRNRDLDANNNELHAQIAKQRQLSQELNDEVSMMRKQLGDTVQQLRKTQSDKLANDKRLAALQASTQYKGGATITANSSLQSSLRMIDMPGLEVRQDGDLVRIELPADKLFQPGTAQFASTAGSILDQVADSIQRNYRNQRIGIEGHTDSTPVRSPLSSSHKLTSDQAIAVFQQLTTRNHLSADQLFTMSFGSSTPRFSNAEVAGRARNRRVELVIYPEKINR